MKKKIYIVLLAVSITLQNSAVCFADEDSFPTTYTYKQNSPNTGWICDNTNIWYYLSDRGEMLTNTITPDGYTVDETGAWIPDAKSYWNMTFSEEDVAFIDFYFVPVPTAARRKHIENTADISRIYTMIMNSIVDKDATHHAISGGGFHLNIVNKGGTNILLLVNSTSVSYMGQHYTLKESLQVEDLWEDMHYDETPISQAELPVFNAIIKN